MNKFNFWVKQKSPELLIGFGLLNAAASVVLACFATKKTIDILKPVKIAIVNVHEKMDTLEDKDQTREQYKIQLRQMYLKTGGKVALTFAPTVLSFVLATVSIISSHTILRNRNVALAAAFTTLKASYDAYRSRIKDKYGDNIERDLFEGNVTEKIVETDENENKKTTLVTTYNKNGLGGSGFQVLWGPGEGMYDLPKNGSLNLTTLLQQEQWFNQKLQAQGYVFLEDVYEQLGFSPAYLGVKKLKGAHTVGWLYIPNDNTRDNYISFGLHDKDGKLTKQALDLQRGLIDSIWLDFNFDGDILSEENGGKAFMRVAMKKGR